MIRIITTFALLICLAQNSIGLELLTENEKETKQEIRELIADLRHDDVRFNAINAFSTFLSAVRENQRESRSRTRQMDRIRRHPDEQARERLRARMGSRIDLYPYFEEQLKVALLSDDWQQRQMAARVFTYAEADPFDALCEVLVEALEDDRMPIWKEDGKVYRTFANALWACIYLYKHSDCVNSELAQALESKDRQQRFYAAMLLAVTGHSENMERIVTILMENLKDDEVRNNAKMAAAAIYKRMDTIKPFLPPMDQLDQQQQQIVKLIQKEWDNHYDRETLRLMNHIGFSSFLRNELQTENDAYGFFEIE